MNVGRNAPCPCGSGKKYKKCCMLAGPAQGDESAARTLGRCSEEAAGALLDHARRTWGEGFLAAAWGAFWGDEGPADVDRDSPYVPLLLSWAIYQWIPEESAEQPHRGTVAAGFLKSSTRRIDAKTRRFIEAASSAALTFWQAASVERGKGMLLRDMATGRECEVQEKSATETLERWDIVFGQVVGLDGVFILNASPPYVLPAARFRRTVEESLPEHADPALLLQYDFDFIDTYLSCVDELLHPTRPDLRNTDGDRLEWTASTYCFDPGARGRVLGRLDQMRNIESEAGEAQKGEAYVWLSPPRDAPIERAARAHIEVGETTLVTECNSRKRDRLLRQRLLKGLGDLLDHEGTRYRDMVEAVEGHAASDAPPEPDGMEELPPEAREQIARHMEAMQMRWADLTVPALGGMTPREAVRTPEGRREVAQLINDFENRQARSPKDSPVSTFDFDKLRRELGLEEQ